MTSRHPWQLFTRGTKTLLAESMLSLDGFFQIPGNLFQIPGSSLSALGDAVDGDLLEVLQPRGRQPVALHRLVVLPVLGAAK